MQSYAAFLRGVTPTNLAVTALKAALESAGFSEVRTLLSSGNAVFATKAQKTELLESKIEKSLARELGTSFMTFVRPVADLQALLQADPYREFRLPSDAKRVVTFLRQPVTAATKAKLGLPIEQQGAKILTVRDREVYSAYVRNSRGPVFMTLLEKTFGKDITTRTWDTVTKAAR